MMQADKLSRLLAAERAVLAPATKVEQGLTRLLADVAAQAAPMPAAVGTAGALKLTTVGVSKWILAGFVAGLAGSGAASQASSRSSVDSEPLPVERVAAVAVALPNASLPRARTEEPASTPSVAAPPMAERPVVRTPGGASRGGNELVPFDEELRLITAAKSELDAGRPHLANIWLNEHAARFPRGVFKTDSDALRVLARCAERRDEASARAFMEQHPGSRMIPRLLRACQAPSAADSLNAKPRLGEPTHD